MQAALEGDLGVRRSASSHGPPQSSAPNSQIFEIILHRSHCRPDPGWQAREGGRDWDTVKPLRVHGFDPARTVIIDDSARKILPEDSACLVQVPLFDAAAVAAARDSALHVDRATGQLPLMRMLCALLVDMLGGGAVGANVRVSLPALRDAFEQVRCLRGRGTCTWAQLSLPR